MWDEKKHVPSYTSDLRWSLWFYSAFGYALPEPDAIKIIMQSNLSHCLPENGYDMSGWVWEDGRDTQASFFAGDKVLLV